MVASSRGFFSFSQVVLLTVPAFLYQAKTEESTRLLVPLLSASHFTSSPLPPSLPWGSKTETLLDPFHLADFFLLEVVLESGRVREDLKCI